MDETCPPVEKKRSGYVILYVAGYLTVAGVAAAEVLTTHAAARLLGVAALLVGITVLLTLLFRGGVWDRTGIVIVLCVATAGCVVGLMVVGFVVQFGCILFFVLCSYIAMRFPPAAALASTAGAALTLLLCLLLRGRPEWLTDSLTFGSGYFGITAFAIAIRRTQQARRASQLLLEELQGAQAQLREAALVEERQRLAREMHDAVGHRLTAASVLLEGAARLIPTDPDRATRAVVTAREQVREGLSELRTAVSALQDDHSTAQPLAGILQALVDVHAQGTQGEVRLTVDPGVGEPGQEAKLTIVRSVQEALTNVQKHANASRVSVSLCRTDTAYVLTCTDNGRGPSAAETNESGHVGAGFGLGNLRARAAALGGSVTLTAAPEGGAVLTLELPVSGEQHG